MDLTLYTCRGLPGDFDRLMRNVPVRGIDREQVQAMVRFCRETEPILYGPDFSPTKIQYQPGSRPMLESIAGNLKIPAMEWVRENVRHPNFAGVDLRPDRALTEEQIIDSGLGWCNEQCRVFIALSQILGFPARLCFLFHSNGKTGHTATEVYIGGKWALFDVTHGVSIDRPGFGYVEARDFHGHLRPLAHHAYETPLTEYYKDRNTPIDLTRGGSFFQNFAITNYLIDGVERVH